VREITRDRRIWNIQRNKLALPFDLLLRTATEIGAFYPYSRHSGTTWSSAG
jgi:hypothetical protein